MTRSVLLSLCFAAACTAATADPSTDAESSSGETPGSSSGARTSGVASSGSTGAPATSTTWSTSGGVDTTTRGPGIDDGADEGYATTSGCGFTCPQPPNPGGGNVFECSLTGADCGEGDRCMPWDNSGGNTWNATRCVPVSNAAGQTGDPCTAEGSYVSGIDDCDVGLWCGPDSAADELELTGTCRRFCDAGPCPGEMICVVPGSLALGVCQPPCDPLNDDACPGSQGCMPAGFGFACHPTDPHGEGEACAATSQCGPGEVCTDATHCGDEPCCAAFCDLSAPDCENAMSCTEWGSPLSAYANVGFCAG